MSQDKRGQGSTDSAGQHPKSGEGNMQRSDQKRDMQHGTEQGDRDKNKAGGNFSQDRDRNRDRAGEPGRKSDKP